MSPYSVANSRASSPGASEQPAKRKKLSTACDACQKRKSRCEMITHKGCHRCRTLGTECSRAGSGTWGPGEDSLNAEAGPSGEHYEGGGMEGSSLGILQDIQARTRRMEGMLGSMMRQSGDRRSHTPAISQHTVTEAAEIQTEEFANPLNASALAHANRALSLHRSHRLSDPVSSGLISTTQWATIYESFRTNITGIIPIRDLLPQSASTHPLLRTCILAYQAATVRFRQSSSPSVQLYHYLRTNLERLPMVPPSRETVLALLILSLAPPSAEDGNSYTPPDKFGAAARAFNAAYAMGMDTAVERVLREDPADIDSGWMRQDVDDMKLWYAVYHRARTVEILDSPYLRVRPPSIPPLNIRRVQELDDPLLAHLSLKSQLLNMIDTVLKPLRVLTTARIYEVEHHDALSRAIKEYQTLTAIWRENALAAVPHCPSAAHLILSNHLFDILLHLCASNFSALPIPLGMEACSRLPRENSAGILIASKSALFFLIQHPDLPVAHLPAFTFTLILLAYMAVSQSKKLEDVSPSPHATLAESPDPRVEPEQAHQIRTRLIHAHPQYTPLLARIDGADAPTLWGEAMRDVQQGLGMEEGAGWGDWEGMIFDFDAFFGGGQAGMGADWFANPDGLGGAGGNAPWGMGMDGGPNAGWGSGGGAAPGWGGAW